MKNYVLKLTAFVSAILIVVSSFFAFFEWLFYLAKVKEVYNFSYVFILTGSFLYLFIVLFIEAIRAQKARKYKSFSKPNNYFNNG